MQTAKSLVVSKVERDPQELETGSALPPPNNFPNFQVEFTYDGSPHKIDMALELGGRDADYEFPEDIDPDEIADICEDLMNAIYGSQAYKDAVEAMERTF
jgi:hypothetical protein